MMTTETNNETSIPEVDPRRVADRAELLPAEQQAGSDDPLAQAKAILEDAEVRRIDAVESPRSAGERHTSSEAAD